MSKQDLREHSDNQLSLLVFNDEVLYRQRHRKGFLEHIKDVFEFTPEQLEVLINDIKEDEEELEEDAKANSNEW